MSENALGFRHALTLGDMPDSRGLEENRKIRQSNLNQISKYQSNLKNAVDSFNTEQAQNNIYKKVGEVVGGELATKGKAIEDTIKGAQKTYEALRDAKAMTFTKLESADRAESFTSEATRMARRAALIGEDAEPIAKTALEGTKVLGGLLQVGLAADDIYNDAKGGFSKLNEAQKTGNVGEIAAGGAEVGAAVVAGSEAVGLTGALEGAGLLLDTSVIGAPLGVALNIAGGILGLVAAGADIVGDEKENEKLKEAKTIAKNTPITSQKQIPIASKALGTTGAEVKNNIQEGR